MVKVLESWRTMDNIIALTSDAEEQSEEGTSSFLP